MKSDIDTIRVALKSAVHPFGTPATEALERLAAVGAERDELRAALTMLRDAWNAHFDTCPQPRLDLPMPTADEIRAWMDAPSDTASA